MSPSRRNSRAGPPARRPRVAGQRRPGTSPSPRPRTERPIRGQEARATTEREGTDESLPPPTDTDGSAASDAAAPDTGEQEVAEPEPEPERVGALTGQPIDAGAPADSPDSSAGVAAEPAPAPSPSPRPKSKPRDVGAPKPASGLAVEGAAAAPATPQPEAPASPEGGGEPETAEGRAAPAKRRRNQYVLAGALVLAALLLAGAAVFFKVKGNEVASATNNAALLDPARTAQVKEEVSGAVEALFSYDFNDIGKTEQAANDLLVTDKAKGAYDKLLGEVKRLAPQQKMVVTTKVTRNGVIMLDGDRAKLLVFVDQTSTRADANETSAGGSQLSVTAQQRDGKWKLTDLNAYTGGGQGQQQAPNQGGQQQAPDQGQQQPPGQGGN